MELRPLALLLGLTLLPSLTLAAGKCDRLVITGSPDAPPLLWRDPQDPTHLIGATADVLQQVAKDLGLKIDLLYGGKRSLALDEVRSGRMDILADAPLNLGELETLDYIHPALMQIDYLVWTRKDSSLVYTTAADLAGHKGAVSERARLSAGFETVASQQLGLQRLPTLTPAFQKLLLKRNDYVIYEQYPGMALARTLGMEDKLKVLDPPVSSEGLYLALSHESPCNRPELRERLQSKMQEIVSGPLPEQLVTQNLERWKRQQEAAH